MKKFDDSTLLALTSLVYGFDKKVEWGLNERGVANFLRRTRVLDDSVSKLTQEQFLDFLRRLNNDETNGLVNPVIEAILKRICDIKEHQGSVRVHERALGRLNDLLCPEGLEIVLDGVTPILREIEPKLPARQRPSAQTVPSPGFSNLVKDPRLAEMLVSRWEEAQKCIQAQAHLSAVIMMGSILECVLLAKATASEREALEAMRTSEEIKDKSKIIEKWGLSELILVASTARWIKKPMKDFSDHIRQYRNLVHPSNQLKADLDVNSRICELCWLVVQEVVSGILSSK